MCLRVCVCVCARCGINKEHDVLRGTCSASSWLVSEVCLTDVHFIPRLSPTVYVFKRWICFSRGSTKCDATAPSAREPQNCTVVYWTFYITTFFDFWIWFSVWIFYFLIGRKGNKFDIIYSALDNNLFSEGCTVFTTLGLDGEELIEHTQKKSLKGKEGEDNQWEEESSPGQMTRCGTLQHWGLQWDCVWGDERESEKTFSHKTSSLPQRPWKTTVKNTKKKKRNAF